MIKIESDFKVEDFTKTLENWLENVKPNVSDMKAMGDILVDELKKNLSTSTNVEGGNFLPNTRKWHNRKMRMGGDTRPLINTGQTLRSIKVKSFSKDVVVVSSIGNSNWWHNTSRFPRYRWSRSWFGISENVVRKILGYWIKKLSRGDKYYYV